METKVFVQISQTYPKIHVYSKDLMKEKHLEQFQKDLRYFSIFYQEKYIVQFGHKCTKQTTTCSHTLN